jgi:pimeloyl-ACP methyl ester carboxylesterase
MAKMQLKLWMVPALLGGAAALAYGAASVPAFADQGAAPMPAGIAPNSDSCANLAKLQLADVDITLAESVASGDALRNSGLPTMYGAPAVVGKASVEFCRVAGHIRPTPDSDIGFEVWLPASGWDGRLHGIGVGGFAGAIDYQILGKSVEAGQAVVASDTGHGGGPLVSIWAKDHPEKLRDYAYRGIHLATVAAKQIVKAYYHKPQDKAYFVGCSGGGRQGLVEAARYPDDYDGILSGAPAASFTQLTTAMVNAQQAQLGQGAAINWAQAKFLQEETVKQCDARDGVMDGLIDDPRQCHVDYSKLACGNSASAQCFTPPQMAALQRIHRGPQTSMGRQLVGGYLPSGAEAGAPAPMLGWEGYILRGGKSVPGSQALIDGILGDFFPKPFATLASFNMDRDPAKLKFAAGDIDAPPNLSRFFARGGKLIIWHGWADAAIPPEASLVYYAAMQRASGAKAGSRLFMIPGVQHCFGGTGPDTFGQAGAPSPQDTPQRNMVSALQAWAERVRPAPENFTARMGHGAYGLAKETPTEKQRLLCAWPKKAVLTQGASPDRAGNYMCI